MNNSLEFRDWLAVNATESDIRRFRQYEKPPIGGPKRPKYTVEQARYRYADAILEARKTRRCE